jgi:hypothetical protein
MILTMGNKDDRENSQQLILLRKIPILTAVPYHLTFNDNFQLCEIAGTSTIYDVKDFLLYYD